MSKKITKEEFLKRFYSIYPNAEIELLDYKAISLPGKIRCKKCGKEHSKKRSRDFLSNYSCCTEDDRTRIQQVKELCEKNKNYKFIKVVNKHYVIIKHLECGNEQKRTVKSCLDNLESCKYCNTISKLNQTSFKEAQQRLDEMFYNEIQLLEYAGRKGKSKYKCLKCGLIFSTSFDSLLSSRGCPKCDKIRSKGELLMEKLLQENNIKYKSQVAVKELPRQHFDFAFYDNDNNLLGYIEVQGEQHFRDISRFRDSLEKIQERDNRKRKYCKENNILLYELIWKNGKFKNLDILPF